METGRYICEALAKPIGARAPIERKENHKQAAELMARYRNTVTQYMQQRKNAIDSLTVIDNRSKTISNSFSITGVGSFTPKEQPAEQLPDYNEEEFNYTPKEYESNDSLRNQFYK